MNYLVPPKVFNWSRTLAQSHKAICPRLIVSGASFTHQNTVGTASNWPGYLYERCGLELVIDYSFPQLGNHYIHDSMRFAFDEIPSQYWQDYFVIVMWNYPIDTIKEESIKVHENWPKLESFYRPKHPQPLDLEHTTTDDTKKISALAQWLTDHSISFAFTAFANLFYQPILLNKTPNFSAIADSISYEVGPDLTITNSIPVE